MLSTMTGGPGGNAARGVGIFAWPGAPALTNRAGGCAGQPAHQMAIRSDPPTRARMACAAYPRRAKPATAAAGAVLLQPPGGLNSSHEERTDIGRGQTGFQRLRRP